jgi:hypothetical protein
MADGNPNDEQNARTRRQRNIVMGLALGALVILFFVMTMVKMAQVGP